ncbi:protein MUS-26- involved in DNA repair [Apiospora arundinis]
MACASAHSGLVNRNGPGSAASSTIESIVNKPTGEKTKCIECDGYECCCIPIPAPSCKQTPPSQTKPSKPNEETNLRKKAQQ